MKSFLMSVLVFSRTFFIGNITFFLCFKVNVFFFFKFGFCFQCQILFSTLHNITQSLQTVKDALYIICCTLHSVRLQKPLQKLFVFVFKLAEVVSFYSSLKKVSSPPLSHTLALPLHCLLVPFVPVSSAAVASQASC